MRLYEAGVRKFLSTPSARRATRRTTRKRGELEISIHALREEGDVPGWDADLLEMLFLSTPSARRATAVLPLRKYWQTFLSTPSARRATERRMHDENHGKISIHALREEGDHLVSDRKEDARYFYPRPPRGGRRSESWITWEPGKISIHALREEGDFLSLIAIMIANGISIHALREEGDHPE